MGTVSRTATLVKGIEKTLAPTGSALLDGAAVPHWYSTYVSLARLLVTTCGTDTFRADNDGSA